MSPSIKPPVKEGGDEEQVHTGVGTKVATKDEMSAPLFSAVKHPNDYTSDDLRTSQRRKVRMGSLKARSNTR